MEENKMERLYMSQCPSRDYCEGYNAAVEKANEIIEALIAGQESLQKHIKKQSTDVERVTNKCEDCAGCTEWKCECSLIEAQAIEDVAKKLEQTISSQLTCSTLEKKEAYYFCLDELEKLKSQSGESQKTIDVPKRIYVQAASGKLVAEVGGDPDYPEIFVFLERKDGAEVDLVAVGTSGKDDPDVKAYLYEDTMRDDYTKSYTWHKEAFDVVEP